jgi:predicted enzyme related to lactoylglutathione lyase
MSERDRYEPGVPCWVDTLQADPAAAMSFYAGVFGWDFAGPGEMPGDPPGEYHVARLADRDVAGVGSVPADAPAAPAWNTYVAVADAGAGAAAVRQAGGSVLVDPFDAPPAGRGAVVADPGGAVFCLWEGDARQGAERVNEPGAWSMSMLQTADTERAGAFYGDVFGWETETFGEGPGAITLWRLPGYVGGEPQQPVPRDVVAVMAPADSSSPPSWSVDFWIDDVDAGAERARRLGGSVVADPFDNPVGRSAVLADPAGAAFSVSKVVPDGA